MPLGRYYRGWLTRSAEASSSIGGMDAFEPPPWMGLQRSVCLGERFPDKRPRAVDSFPEQQNNREEQSPFEFLTRFQRSYIVLSLTQGYGVLRTPNPGLHALKAFSLLKNYIVKRTKE